MKKCAERGLRAACSPAAGAGPGRRGGRGSGSGDSPRRRPRRPPTRCGPAPRITPPLPTGRHKARPAAAAGSRGPRPPPGVPRGPGTLVRRPPLGAPRSPLPPPAVGGSAGGGEEEAAEQRKRGRLLYSHDLGTCAAAETQGPPGLGWGAGTRRELLYRCTAVARLWWDLLLCCPWQGVGGIAQFLQICTVKTNNPIPLQKSPPNRKSDAVS